MISQPFKIFDIFISYIKICTLNIKKSIMPYAILSQAADKLSKLSKLLKNCYSHQQSAQIEVPSTSYQSVHTKLSKRFRKTLGILIQNFVHTDVVLHHTLPVFTGLGRCPIVSWDFAGAVSIFWTGCPSCRPPMTFTGIRTRDLSSDSRSS